MYLYTFPIFHSIWYTEKRDSYKNGCDTLDEKLLKPISEATYLTTENAWRYRAVLRYFYLQHERLRHYLFPEEVYHHLKQSPYFQDYTEEHLQNDLYQLVQWKNLIPRQETGKVNTIEDFKRKKFRYQATPYTIEIERMVHGLEQIGDSFGGSLESTLFDQLLSSLNQLTATQHNPFLTENQQPSYKVDNLSNEELNRLWEDMFEQFRKLTENATDYLAYLKSEKVEDVMRTEAFLVFKDALTEYLRNFMTKLQRSSYKIEAILRNTPAQFINKIAKRLASYQQSIPRMVNPPDFKDLHTKYLEQWQSVLSWFLGSENQRESEIIFLQNETNETIRRMTRFAQRIGEKQNNFRSRRKDYLHLAKWFHEIEDIKEAHKLSSVVFGVFHTKHLFAETSQTEDIYAEVWDQKPTTLTLNPRIRQFREKTKPSAIINRDQEKEEMLKEYMLQKEAEQKMLEKLIVNHRIVLSELPVIDPYIRKTILSWISRAMSDSDQTGKTETGQYFKLIKLGDEMITLHSDDGSFTMPDYALYFKQ